MKKKDTLTDKTKNTVEEEILDSSKDFSAATIESNFETSFFYTNDKFINQIDNNELFLCISSKYPELNINNDDPIIKKQLAVMLDDDNFILYILLYYNLTIFEFFSILYKQFSSIFRGPYLKKLKNILAVKKYTTNARKQHDY